MADSTQQKAAQPSVVPDWMRPSVKTKIAYAVPYFPLSVLGAMLMIELQIYYTDTLLVPAGLLALIIAVSRAWDAINDPAMGWISDHTRTKWGRRIPYIAIGVPLTAVCFYLLFVPPSSFTPLQICLWGGIVFFFYYLFNTIWQIPYNALGFELTPDYNDRTSLFGYRVFVSAFGFIFAFGLLFYLKYADVFEGDDRRMLSLFGAIGGFLMILFFALPVFTIKENPLFLQFKRSPMVPGIRRAMRNGPFKLLFWVMLIGTIPITLPILIMPYFVKYVVAAPSHYRLVYALLYVIAGFVAIPLWMYIGKRWGKVHVWMVAVGIGVVASLAMFFIGKGQLWAMGIVETVRGFGSTASQVLIPAMIADVVDYDEFNTGKRREAQFGAFLGLLPKFVIIISGALPLAVLGLVGYDPAAGGINDNTHTAIRLLYAILPFGFHLVCLVLLFFYPLSAEVHAAIREGVELHKKGQAAKDPLTGHMKMPVDAQAVPEDTGWFLDYFSPRELKRIVVKGASGVVGSVYVSVFLSAAVAVATAGGVYYILIGAMSASQADQARQAIASGLVFVCGLSIAVTIYHMMRIRTAQKMKNNPVGKELIQTHLNQL